ncbi:ABC transporter ATP-binding protein/permease [Bacteriovoracaceae bacterium]|nr:ABC transporter ATP-binding protein/permease [Bacteriovoracaceae bacterium]
MIDILKKIFPFLRPNLSLAMAAAVCSLPLAAIKSYQAYFIKDVFDKGFAPESTNEEAIYLASILIGLAILNYPLRFLHFYGMRMVVDRATCLIRLRIYEKLQQLPHKVFSQEKGGNFLSIMINDTVIFSEAFMHSLDIIREPLTAILLLGVAFYHDWQLTLAIFLMLPAFLVVFNITGKIIRKYVTKAQEDTAEMTHHATEGLQGQKIIKAFDLQNYMINRFKQSQNLFLSNKQKSNSAEEHSHPLIELIAAFAFGLVIILAHHRIQEGSLTTGGFVSFIAAMAMFMDPIRKFSKSNVKLNQARAASSRIFKFLNLEEEEGSISESTEIKFERSIELKDVSFSYDGKQNVLKNISLKINKGEKIAFVGLSGSGKSTLISLMLGLYPVENGDILIDGKSIQGITLAKLRKYFSLVSQDVFLFNDTVEENLKAGREISPEMMRQALTISYSENFISELGEKEKTVIGDRGLRLSGGQAQRITIARAFLKNSPIYLFDEATSALDNESEKMVQKALEKLERDHTVIAVAHRLSTIKNYDKIFVFKSGEIIEEGNHNNLLKNNGEYAKLYALSNV